MSMTKPSARQIKRARTAERRKARDVRKAEEWALAVRELSLNVPKEFADKVYAAIRSGKR